MILKCENPECQKLLSIKNSELAKNKSRVRCPACGKITQVRHTHVKCGNPSCGKSMKYYEYLLDPKNPVIVCPSCQQVNKVKVKNTSFLIHKS